MTNKIRRTIDGALLLLVVLGIASTCWAGPPAPPVIIAPKVPVSGAETGIATTLAIVAYGIWKSRK